ncbi:peroxin-10 [Strigomonas culicis]|uniref:Peroxin-10 n=1 Tax=Strigomonas culicis TaxID=28005 RepID=S9UFF5_9TRYP|nr:peroxin-10 [Strigomonas culicis]|eukprot:EPY27469.1 peroxin-10 [Strigomonas culicis]
MYTTSLRIFGRSYRGGIACYVKKERHKRRCCDALPAKRANRIGRIRAYPLRDAAPAEDVAALSGGGALAVAQAQHAPTCLRSLLVIAAGGLHGHLLLRDLFLLAVPQLAVAPQPHDELDEEDEAQRQVGPRRAVALRKRLRGLEAQEAGAGEAVGEGPVRLEQEEQAQHHLVHVPRHVMRRHAREQPPRRVKECCRLHGNESGQESDAGEANRAPRVAPRHGEEIAELLAQSGALQHGEESIEALASRLHVAIVLVRPLSAKAHTGKVCRGSHNSVLRQVVILVDGPQYKRRRCGLHRQDSWALER